MSSHFNILPTLRFSLATGPMNTCRGRNTFLKGLDKVKDTGKAREKLCLLPHLKGPVSQQILIEFLPCVKQDDL